MSAQRSLVDFQDGLNVAFGGYQKPNTFFVVLCSGGWSATPCACLVVSFWTTKGEGVLHERLLLAPGSHPLAHKVNAFIFQGPSDVCKARMPTSAPTSPRTLAYAPLLTFFPSHPIFRGRGRDLPPSYNVG